MPFAPRSVPMRPFSSNDASLARVVSCQSSLSRVEVPASAGPVRFSSPHLSGRLKLGLPRHLSGLLAGVPALAGPFRLTAALRTEIRSRLALPSHNLIEPNQLRDRGALRLASADFAANAPVVIVGITGARSSTDRVADFESEGCRFESYRARFGQSHGHLALAPGDRSIG